MDPIPHLDDETLACLVDGVLTPEEGLVARSHLSHCARCAGIYAEVLQLRLHHRLHPEPGRAVPRPVRAGRMRRQRVLALAATAAAALFLVLGLGVTSDPGVDPALRAPVRQALAGYVLEGLPLPGIEPAEAGEYRSGGARRDLDEALDALSRAYVEKPGNRETAWWLAAGYVAAGRLDNAQLVLEQVSRRGEPDLRFRLLEADLALLLADPDRAARILQKEPRSEHARLGLALARRAQGRTPEARQILEDLARDARDPAVRRRAQAERQRF